MRDISEFPMTELVSDLKVAIEGLVAASSAKASGISSYGGNSSAEELAYSEQRIIDVILKEILRRGEG